jgi:hypothetical protein
MWATPRRRAGKACALLSLVAILAAGCGADLAPSTVRVSPLQPPDVDPLDGFGGRVLLEARTARTEVVFHLELFRGTRMELRREVGRLALASPARITTATETSAGGGSLRVELQACDPDGVVSGETSSFACALPAEFPATGGMTSSILLLDQGEYPDDAFVPLFGVRRGGTISFTGPEGPFGASEVVLRVVARLE